LSATPASATATNRCRTTSRANIQDEGIDILDVEGNSSTNGTGINYNVRSDSLSYPTCEFPPDLFGFVFGTQACWITTTIALPKPR
jgi:hypothetical protein